MTVRAVIIGAILLTSAVGKTSFAGETVESIEKQARERWAKVQSLSASTRLESERKYPDRVIKKATTGTYLFLRAGEVEKVRQELETHQDIEMTMGKDTPMTTIPSSEKKLMVGDGQTILMLTESTRGTKGAKMIQKGSGIVIGGNSLFEMIRKVTELQVLPDSRFEGREAWVVQAIQNKGYSKTSYLIDKEWGVLLQRVTFQAKDEEDVPATTYTISNLKVNGGDVSADKFTFEFPPGLEINDETKAEE